MSSSNCFGNIPNTFIMCGEGGNFCSEECAELAVEGAASEIRRTRLERMEQTARENRIIQQSLEEARRQMTWRGYLSELDGALGFWLR